jgi:hypothetical protein
VEEHGVHEQRRRHKVEGDLSISVESDFTTMYGALDHFGKFMRDGHPVIHLDFVKFGVQTP